MTVKPPLTGLIDRQGPCPRRWAPYLNGYVIKVPWDLLQPGVSGGINTQVIDDQLCATERFVDDVWPWAHQRAALRIEVGLHAPQWVHALAGSIPWDQGTPGSSEAGGLIPRWWTPGMLDAYTHLHELLAARYDDDERVTRIDLGMPVSLYSPEVCGIGATKANREALAEAGWTPMGHLSAFAQATQAHAELWKRTPTAAAFAALPGLDGARAVADGLWMLDRFRGDLGDRACAMTTFLNPWKVTRGGFVEFLTEQRADREHACVQTAAWSRLDDGLGPSAGTLEECLQATLLTAHAVAGSVELPHGYERLIPDNVTGLTDLARDVLGPWVVTP